MLISFSCCNHSNENCFVICSSYTPLHVCLNVWVPPPLPASPYQSSSSLSMPCKVPQPTPFKQGTFFVTPSCQGSIALAAIRSAAVRNIDSQRAWSSTAAPLQFHICLPLFLSAPLCLHPTLQAGICLMPWTLHVRNPLQPLKHSRTLCNILICNLPGAPLLFQTVYLSLCFCLHFITLPK